MTAAPMPTTGPPDDSPGDDADHSRIGYGPMDLISGQGGDDSDDAEEENQKNLLAEGFPFTRDEPPDHPETGQHHGDDDQKSYIENNTSYDFDIHCNTCL
ncbi:hypothetical protein J3A84_04470 [Proteiniclasticum sp. SCR006]|uniref:Uncharacterized protein n=1 Tax=Proteiniclasticum aestuarii TaxID=2817862 RepID=A0A939H514_9CLOT|nr:hypothetical protein [Proteiniclasticum aestuarii]MBO1264294.1 hypothetical protein [Proteiniclasticum aestuarii]